MVNQYVCDKQIDRYGESVSLRTVNSSTLSDWGDVTEATSDTTITAVLNDIQGDEEFNSEGRYQPGDKVFFVKSDVSVSVNDKIIFDSNTYEIKDVIAHRLQGKSMVKELRTSKV